MFCTYIVLFYLDWSSKHFAELLVHPFTHTHTLTAELTHRAGFSVLPDLMPGRTLLYLLSHPDI